MVAKEFGPRPRDEEVLLSNAADESEEVVDAKGAAAEVADRAPELFLPGGRLVVFVASASSDLLGCARLSIICDPVFFALGESTAVVGSESAAPRMVVDVVEMKAAWVGSVGSIGPLEPEVYKFPFRPSRRI